MLWSEIGLMMESGGFSEGSTGWPRETTHHHVPVTGCTAVLTEVSVSIPHALAMPPRGPARQATYLRTVGRSSAV